MNKLLLTSAAVLAMTVTSAHADERYAFFADPYIGAFGGYGWSDAGEADLDGADYGIYAGMRVDTLLDNTINRLGLGITGALEVHYGWSSQDDTVAGVDLDKKDEFGISFRPGLTIVDRINPLDFNTYGILGYKRAEYEASVGGLAADEDYDGFELGLGTELVAYDNMGVRLEYAHTWYEEKDDVDPDEDTVRLGVSYQF